MLQPLVLPMADRTATITQISKPTDEKAVRDAVLQVPGAYYFVQRDFVNDMYAQFRDSTFRQLLVGELLVLGVLVIRYRRWRPTLAAFLPSVLVPVVVLSGLALAGESINLLHIMSLMMVTGMGVDYGIFVVDGGEGSLEVETTFVSLLLCCLTTVCGFGVLAISAHPALRAMGVTIGSGVLLSLVLAPVSLLVLGRGGAASGGEGAA
jgi:predicted exporter